MSNKTPYEIRTELLKMSQDYLTQQYQAQMEFSKEAFTKAVEAGKATMEEWQKYAPQFYNFSDVLKKAEELYSFVDRKEKK